MKINNSTYRSFTISAGMVLLAILLFLLIPLSYRITLPFEYWVNQFIFFMLLISLTFLNTKYLAPKLLFQKKHIIYFGILLSCCVLIILILQQTEDLLNIPEAIHRAASDPSQPFSKRKSGVSVALYIFLVEVLVMGVNITGIIVRKWEEEANLRLIMENEKVDLELSFLKSQINPHFFFNSLNTVNALSYSNLEESRIALKKLSTIMRYVLYNSSSTKASLSKEIEFIKNYIELMELRSSKKVNISLVIKTDVEDINIAPMLFLSIIENCFKHGVSTQFDSPINISLQLINNKLIFCTENNLFRNSIDKNGSQDFGIGLKNTMRRLDLIYANKYSFDINQSNDKFIVELRIDLDEN